MSPELPTKEKPAPTKKILYRAPIELVAEIDAEAKVKGLSRTEAMNHLLRFGLDAIKKDAKPKKK
jgi:hypothetical protein